MTEKPNLQDDYRKELERYIANPDNLESAVVAIARITHQSLGELLGTTAELEPAPYSMVFYEYLRSQGADKIVAGMAHNRVAKGMDRLEGRPFNATSWVQSGHLNSGPQLLVRKVVNQYVSGGITQFSMIGQRIDEVVHDVFLNDPRIVEVHE